MSTAEKEAMQYETIDVNIIPDAYVTWIVDIWKGKRHDPATTVTRYIGVWRAEDLEKEDGEAIDPDFSGMGTSYYGSSHIKPRPLHWAELETIKEGDHEAEMYRRTQQNMLDTERHRYGTDHRRDELYQKFLEAIDTLAERPEDQFAWEAVDRWRAFQLDQLER